MPKSSYTPADWKPLTGFGLTLFIPSTGIVAKHLGLWGVVLYGLLVVVCLWLAYRYLFALILARISARWALWLLALTFAVLFLLFSAIYPIANAGMASGGSDNDEALTIATTELLQGRYPYYPRTYLGNPISPLPGSLLLAVPFVLLGNGAYQNFFWLVIFALILNRYLGDSRKTLLLLWITLLLSPSVLHQLIIGSDYIANSLFVLVFTLLTIEPFANYTRERRSIWPAILLGVALASRANFILVLPLVFAALGQRAGFRTAVTQVTMTCIVFGFVTLPFYFYDPPGFSPLHTANKLGQFQPLIPAAGIVLPLVAWGVAGLLSLRNNRDIGTCFAHCTLVLAFPVLCGIVFASLSAAGLDFRYAFYGIFFLFFGVVAFGPALLAIPRVA